jgi:hypothetical protein
VVDEPLAAQLTPDRSTRVALPLLFAVNESRRWRNVVNKMTGRKPICNVEPEFLQAGEFEESPEGITIHTTARQPHTLDGWPARMDANGKWIVDDMEVAAIPCNVSLEEK